MDRARFGEDFFEGEEGVEGGGEAGVDGGLHEEFGELGFCPAEFEGAVEVGFEFEGGVVHGGEHGDGGKLAGFEVEAGAGVDFAEGEVADHIFEIGGDVVE